MNWRKTALATAVVALLVTSVLGINWLHRRPLAVSFDNHGLSSIRYHGTELLKNGIFHVNRVILRRSSGTTYNADLHRTVSVDRVHQVIRQSFRWGTMEAAYASVGNRLDLKIKTVNSSPDFIDSVYYEPMTLSFGTKLQEYDGVVPILGHNIGGPTILPLTFGKSRLVLTNDDVTRPLLIGFPWAVDRPKNTVFPLRINTGSDRMYPDSLPFIARSIAPGQRDEYHLSLRFGRSTDSEISLASDVCRRFAAAFPRTLRWDDHRPIGTLSLATSARVMPTNPRGWLNDSSIDVTNPEGIDRFRKRLLAFADTSIAVLTDMNAQGMITWDIEGEESPQAVYIGDPQLTTAMAPEMTGVVDEYFQRFRDAGFRVGVCVRPQELIRSADPKAAYQKDSRDPFETLRRKIAYAKQRWGATLFFIPYNGLPSRPLVASVFARLVKEFPDVLLIPEHKNPEYYAYSAPYSDLKAGSAGTPELIRAIYPSAFSSINTADGQIDMRHDDLVAGVKGGDILLYRSWYPDPANAAVKDIYEISGSASISLPYRRFPMLAQIDRAFRKP